MLKLLMSPAGLRFDRWLVRWTGHSLLNVVFARQQGFAPKPALLLTTRGRQSGELRSVALPYLELDGQRYIVASRGGMPTDPAWALNLRAEPRATIHVRRKAERVQAEFITGEERNALWPRVVQEVPTYADYQARTSREIPLIRLMPLNN